MQRRIISNRNRVHIVASVSLLLLTLTTTTSNAQTTPIFSPAAPLYPNAITDTGSDSQPSIVTDKMGTWAAVWSSLEVMPQGVSLGTDSDIFVSTNAGAGWSNPSHLNSTAPNSSPSDSADALPEIATDGTDWLVVWTSNSSISHRNGVDTPVGSDADIFFSSSPDPTGPWTFATELHSSMQVDTGADFQPQVTHDGARNWLAVWSSNEDLPNPVAMMPSADLDTDIFYSTSEFDVGFNTMGMWSAPQVLNTNAFVDTQGDSEPHIAFGNNTWMAVWTSTENIIGPGFQTDEDADILVSTAPAVFPLVWSDPELLNGSGDNDFNADYEPQVTYRGGTTWVAVWTSEHNLPLTAATSAGTDTDIFVAISTDNGASWTLPDALNTNAGTDVGDDVQPRITFDNDRSWLAVWRSKEILNPLPGFTLGQDSDILFATSSNFGFTWSAPLPLYDGARSDVGADAQPRIATDELGEWRVIWSSLDTLSGSTGNDADIYISRVDILPTGVFPGTIKSNRHGEPLLPGESLMLTAPSGTSHAWKKDGITLADNGRVNGTTTQNLNISPLATGDSGAYTVVYNDGAKAIVESAPYPLTVGMAILLPAMGFGALVGTILAIIVVGVLRRARHNNSNKR